MILLKKKQVPNANTELMLDNIAQIVKTKEKEPSLFSLLDLPFAYSQIPLIQKPKNNAT